MPLATVGAGGGLCWVFILVLHCICLGAAGGSETKKRWNVCFQSRKKSSTVAIEIISNIPRCHGRALFGVDNCERVNREHHLRGNDSASLPWAKFILFQRLFPDHFLLMPFAVVGSVRVFV